MATRENEKQPAAADQPADARIDKLVTMLVAGLSREQIADYTAGKEGWQVTAAQLEELLDTARRRLIAEGRSDRRGELGVALRRLNDLYSRSLKNKDCATALQTQKEINRLLRLDEVVQRRNEKADLFFKT